MIETIEFLLYLLIIVSVAATIVEIVKKALK